MKLIRPKKVLIEARKEIEDIDNWCQGALALNPRNIGTHPNHPRAQKFCALGAVSKIVNFRTNPRADGRAAKIAAKRLDYSAKKLFSVSKIEYVNDHSGFYTIEEAHRNVLECYDDAINSTRFF